MTVRSAGASLHFNETEAAIAQDRTYDLNTPEDAKAYIQAWVDRGEVMMGTREIPSILDDGTEEDFLLVAKQLFLFCDERPPLGKHKEAH